MRQLFPALPTAGLALLLLLASGCSRPAAHNSDSHPQSSGNPSTLVDSPDTTSATAGEVIEGESQPLGNGTVRAYVALNAQNQIQEIGVIITEGALSGLPNEETEVMLALPPQAAGTAINHIGLDWRPHGHEPGPIYGSAHFDIHAYTLTPEDREQITAVGEDLAKAYKTPAPDLIPAGYVLAPDSAEPRMGSHWVDPTLAEFQGHPHGFDHTMIYGFYDGAIAFLEPMVDLEFLKSRQSVEKTFPVAERYAQQGLFPTQYQISYNEETREHRVTLAEFQ